MTYDHALLQGGSGVCGVPKELGMEGEKRQIRRRWWASAAYDSIGERSSGREGFRQDAIEWDSRVFRGKMGHLSCF
jgi:hypothetical protein